jgi:hypothetical protein
MMVSPFPQPQSYGEKQFNGFASIKTSRIFVIYNACLLQKYIDRINVTFALKNSFDQVIIFKKEFDM